MDYPLKTGRPRFDNLRFEGGYLRPMNKQDGCKHGHLKPCTQCYDEEYVRNLKAKLVAAEERTEKAEVELNHRKGDPVTWLHNICKGISEDADGSDFSREEWNRVDKEGNALRAENKILKERAGAAEAEAKHFAARSDGARVALDDLRAENETLRLERNQYWNGMNNLQIQLNNTKYGIDPEVHRIACEQRDADRSQVQMLKGTLEDLSCDGCEYGDNCPSNANHYKCRACQCIDALKRTALDQQSDKAIDICTHHCIACGERLCEHKCEDNQK